MNPFKHHNTNIIKYDFVTKFHNKNIYHTPKVQKIVLNFGIKEVNFKQLVSFIAALELISYQRVLMAKASTSNISLKVRKGAPVGCKVTLRKPNIYAFFFKLNSRIFTNIKQFEMFSGNLKHEHTRTFSFRLYDILNFAEIENQYELFKRMSKLDISIVTNSKKTNDLNVLLTSFRFPIK